MSQGNIQKWLKKVGDEVIPGDALAAIETDKAVVDFEMQEEGYVAALLYPEGAKDVELGKIVAVLVDNKEDVAAFANYTGESASAPASAPAAAEASPTPAAAAAPTQQASQPAAASGDRQFVSPLAKRMAEEKGLSLDGIQGSGPNHRIIAADVAEAKVGAPAAS